MVVFLKFCTSTRSFVTSSWYSPCIKSEIWIANSVNTDITPTLKFLKYHLSTCPNVDPTITHFNYYWKIARFNNIYYEVHRAKQVTISARCIYYYYVTRNYGCLLLVFERGFQRTKVCSIWVSYVKLIRVQSFIGRWLKFTSTKSYVCNCVKI